MGRFRTDLEGQVLFERFRVIRRLGEGGTAEVYLVEHLGLRRQEALKLLRVEHAHEREFVARFRREARAINRLQHRNIVGVHDFGQLPDGHFYLTTEYVDGTPLSSHLDHQGHLDTHKAVNIIMQLAEAIHHAHQRGVIHRDLKPSNMLLVNPSDSEGLLKVLDFGIAKIIAPDYKETFGTTRGNTQGTPLYMAPEQIQGNGRDPRSDIYALGVVAYELLTGAPPFMGSLSQVLHAHLHTPAPTLSLTLTDRTVPDELDQIVDKCLQKSVDDRFSDSRDLLFSLRHLAELLADETNKIQLRNTLLGWGPASSYEDDPVNPEPLVDPRGDTISLNGGSSLTRTESDQEVQLVQSLVISLAESIIDQGCQDFQLIIGMGNIRDLESEIENIDIKITITDSMLKRESIRVQKQENSLRLALSELRFGREGARPNGDTGDASLDIVQPQIHALEERLRTIMRYWENEKNTKLTELSALNTAKNSAQTHLHDLYKSLGILALELCEPYQNSLSIVRTSKSLWGVLSEENV